jgi:Zn-dependent protease
MFISTLFESPILFIAVALSLVVSLTIHEFAHAYVSNYLGDPTAKYLGRVTINPLKHLDPLGTVLLLVLGFGWGKPVPFDPRNLKNPKRDAALISFAGPLSNLILAVLFAFVYHLSISSQGFLALVGVFSFLMVQYNLLLAFFNLIPVHPLDGFKVVYGLLPKNLAVQWIQFERYGFYILLFLLLTRSINTLISPFIDISMKILGVEI